MPQIIAEIYRGIQVASFKNPVAWASRPCLFFGGKNSRARRPCHLIRINQSFRNYGQREIVYDFHYDFFGSTILQYDSSCESQFTAMIAIDSNRMICVESTVVSACSNFKYLR